MKEPFAHDDCVSAVKPEFKPGNTISSEFEWVSEFEQRLIRRGVFFPIEGVLLLVARKI